MNDEADEIPTPIQRRWCYVLVFAFAFSTLTTLYFSPDDDG
jgi:hypothetical protein